MLVSGGGVVAVSAYMGGTRGSGVLASAYAVLEISSLLFSTFNIFSVFFIMESVSVWMWWDTALSRTAQKIS